MDSKMNNDALYNALPEWLIKRHKTMSTDKYAPWSMDSTSIDDVDYIHFPVIVQPKLNGVRCCWNHKRRLLISRQNKVWRRELLPHIYKVCDIYTNFSWDGELYCHGMPFQDICARVSINANEPHEDVEKIGFYVFDEISKHDTVARQLLLEQLYPTIVPHFIAGNQKDLDEYLTQFLKLGYEGIMIRLAGVPYQVGRTKALIKVKPWIYDKVIIKDCKEGLGKFKGALGAFQVAVFHNEHGTSRTFNVGGGNITEAQRAHIWTHKQQYYSKTLEIKYRELSNSGLPLQPQIVKLPIV